MASRYEPPAGLEALVAARLARRVSEVAEDVADVARDLAPGTKTWRSREDAVTRPEHHAADGQAVPDNLRFVLDSPAYDREHYGAAARQQLRAPRDPAGTPGLVAHCRCEMTVDPEGLAAGIHAHPAVVDGTVVTAAVTSRGPRVAEAEYGTDGDEAARYMGRAARAVASRRGA